MTVGLLIILRISCQSFDVFTLNDGNMIPRLGFGTYRTSVRNAVIKAAEVGFRHFDCAAFYGNEKEVGDAFEELFTKRGFKRKEFFITSKLWNVDHKPERVRLACEKTLKDLRLTYLDLYVMHKPIAWVPWKGMEPVYENGKPKIDMVPIEVTWAAMEELVALNLVKSLGTSTLPIGMLHNLLMGCKIKPVCNQVELHPFLHEDDLIQYCRAAGIFVVAFCPLARPGQIKNDFFNILKNEIIVRIAVKHRKTPAQVSLRWNLQRAPNVGVIPKSTTPARIEENFKVYDFVLDADDMKEIKKLNKQFRISRPKVQMGVGFLGDENYLNVLEKEVDKSKEKRKGKHTEFSKIKNVKA